MSTPTNSADASCGELSCDECNARTAALTAERDQLRLDCDNETKWAAHYLAQSIADKARAERAEAELAAERARLDWFHEAAGDSIWVASQDIRAAIDAAMKEDAK